MCVCVLLWMCIESTHTSTNAHTHACTHTLASLSHTPPPPSPPSLCSPPLSLTHTHTFVRTQHLDRGQPLGTFSGSATRGSAMAYSGPAASVLCHKPLFPAHELGQSSYASASSLLPTNSSPRGSEGSTVWGQGGAGGGAARVSAGPVCLCVCVSCMYVCL